MCVEGSGGDGGGMVVGDGAGRRVQVKATTSCFSLSLDAIAFITGCISLSTFLCF